MTYMATPRQTETPTETPTQLISKNATIIAAPYIRVREALVCIRIRIAQYEGMCVCTRVAVVQRL